MRHLFILLLSIAFTSIYSFGQNIFNKHFDSEDGLPSNEIYDAVEDNDGFIWFATDMGVSKHNGYEFINYSFDSTVLDNTILKLYKAPNGFIWFISLNGYLAYYNYKEIVVFERNNELTPFVEKHGIYTSFNITQNNEIYFGIKAVGLLEITPKTPINLVIGDSSNHKVNRVIKQIENFLSYSILYNGGARPFQSDSLRLRLNNNIVFTFPSLYNNISFFNSFPVDENKWLCSYGPWVFYLHNDKVSILKKMSKDIICLQKGANNEIWLGLNRGGIYNLDLDDLYKENIFLKGMSVSSILFNKEHSLWCTTTEKGVFYSSNSDNTFFFEEETRTNNIIDTYLIRDSLFVLFSNNTIYSINNNKVTLMHQLLSKYNLSWLDNVDNELYSGNIELDAAFKINSKSIKKIDSYPKSGLSSILKQKEDSVYMRLYKNGVWLHNKDVLGFFGKVRESRYDYSLQIKSKIYLGNKSGLWSMENNKLEHLNSKFEIGNSRVIYIASNQNDQIVLGTKSNGIKILSPTKNINITTNEGISSNNILHITIEQDTIWCSTYKGLNKIIVNSDNTYSITHTSLKDGLISEVILKSIPDGNYLWLHTPKGIIKLNRNVFQSKQQNLKLINHSVLINDSIYSKANNYKLLYHQNNISINYIGLDYNTNKELEYHYQMVGLSNKWYTTKNRNLTFTSLQPGHYSFKIYASNLQQQSDIISFDIEIAKPFWNSWWFILLEVVLILLLILYLFKIRSKVLVQKIIKQETEKRENIELQLKALRAQMNPHFMFNSLNSILYYILENDIDLAAKYLSKFSKLIRFILQNSEDGHVSLKTEIDTLNLYLELEQIRLENKFNYTINYEEGLNLESIKIPTLLIQPIVENAVWHGIMNKLQKGNINLFFKKDKQNIICTVKDDGIGRKTSAKNRSSTEFKKSLGLTISKKRLELLHNQIIKEAYIKTEDLFNEDLPAGTIVTLTIPLKED